MWFFKNKVKIIQKEINVNTYTDTIVFKSGEVQTFTSEDILTNKLEMPILQKGSPTYIYPNWVYIHETRTSINKDLIKEIKQEFITKKVTIYCYEDIL